MQQVGMADQDGRSGILQDVIDLLRLEVPVDRHRVGAEPHRGIGRLDEGDVVAQEHADAVARPNAERIEATSDAGAAIGNFGVAAPPLAADDAEEEGGCIGHVLFQFLRAVDLTVVIARSTCDEAIQSFFLLSDGLLRCARNDGLDGGG
jgi:hypothetical protein